MVKIVNDHGAAQSGPAIRPEDLDAPSRRPPHHPPTKKKMALTRVAEPFRAAGGAGGALEIDDGD